MDERHTKKENGKRVIIKRIKKHIKKGKEEKVYKKWTKNIEGNAERKRKNSTKAIEKGTTIKMR